MKTGFKKYDSSYKRKESPFTRYGIGIPDRSIPSQNLADARLPLSRSKEKQRERDEANKEELLAKAKGRLIKKAERKESKAAKRKEQGREAAAARKTRKATKLRKQASELTADQVVRRREQMRDSAERRQERTRSRITPFTSKKLLKKVSSQLKAASKKHAGQAAKIDKATSAMKLQGVEKEPPRYINPPLHIFPKPEPGRIPSLTSVDELPFTGPIINPPSIPRIIDEPGVISTLGDDISKSKKSKNSKSKKSKNRSNPFMKRVSATGRKKLERTIFPFDSHERVDYHGLGVKGANKRKIKIRKEKDMPKEGIPGAMKKKEVPSKRIKSKLRPRTVGALRSRKTLVEPNYKPNYERVRGKAAPPMKKISGPCKAAAKRKFKVWPSAYASGWGVRCTKAGGPSKFGR